MCRRWVLTFAGSLMLISWTAHSATDAPPWGFASMMPMLGFDGALGGRWTAVAYSLSVAGITANPATMLSQSGFRVETFYQVRWGMPVHGERFDDDRAENLSFWGALTAGWGVGIAVMRHQPYVTDFAWVRDEQPWNAESRIWPERVRWRSQWTRWGVGLALRLQEDFIVGGILYRDTFSSDTVAVVEPATKASVVWSIHYEGRDRTWSGTAGVQWWLSPNVVVGLAYHWMPSFTIPATLEMAEGALTQTEMTEVDIAFPDALTWGVYVQQIPWTMTLEGWRWKPGALNETRGFQLYLGVNETLIYRAIWGWRTTVGYTIQSKKYHLTVHVGTWYRPTLRPTWTGPEANPLAPLFSHLWPSDQRRLHWTLGLTLRLPGRLNLSAGYLRGPDAQTLIISLMVS